MSLSSIFETGFAQAAISSQVILDSSVGFGLFNLAWVIQSWKTRRGIFDSPTRSTSLFRRVRAEREPVSRVWPNPLVWKDFYFLAGGNEAIVIKFALNVVISALVCVLMYYAGFMYRGMHLPDYGAAIVVTSLALAACELALFASRIFNEELKWNTLGVTLMMPRSPTRIAYGKLVGCLLTMVPSVVCCLVGTALAPKFVGEHIVTPETWGGVVAFAAFLHVTAFLSLYVKWGALPAAIGIVFIFGTCCIYPLFSLPMMMIYLITDSETALIMPTIYLGALTIAGLQFLIGQRLTALSKR